MTAPFKSATVGAFLVALPTAAECLLPGAHYEVRDRGEGLCVRCKCGWHFLWPTRDDTLRDFAEVRDEEASVSPPMGGAPKPSYKDLLTTSAMVRQAVERINRGAGKLWGATREAGDAPST